MHELQMSALHLFSLLSLFRWEAHRSFWKSIEKNICKTKEVFYVVFKELLLKTEGLFQDYTLTIYT